MQLTAATAILGLASLAFATPISKGDDSWLEHLKIPSQGTFEFTVCCDVTTTVTTNIPGACSAIPKNDASGYTCPAGTTQYNCYFNNGQVVSLPLSSRPRSIQSLYNENA